MTTKSSLPPGTTLIRPLSIAKHFFERLEYFLFRSCLAARLVRTPNPLLFIRYCFSSFSQILCYPNSPNMHARAKEQKRDWLFKGPKESEPLLIPIFQTLLLELAGEVPPAAVVLSFPFDCLG